MYIFMITCYVLMLINLINLTLTGASGYWNFEIMGASHTRFALFTILIFTITETIVMYFFISTGKAIKSAIESGLGRDELWSRERKLKMIYYSFLHIYTIFGPCGSKTILLKNKYPSSLSWNLHNIWFNVLRS